MLFRIDTDLQQAGFPDGTFYVEAPGVEVAIQAVNTYTRQKYDAVGRTLNVAWLTDTLLITHPQKDLGEAEVVE